MDFDIITSDFFTEDENLFPPFDWRPIVTIVDDLKIRMGLTIFDDAGNDRLKWHQTSTRF